MEKIDSLSEQVCAAVDSCSTAWQYLILGKEKEAMELVPGIINLVEEIVLLKSNDVQTRKNQEKIVRLLPRMLKAMEERNGIVLADILEYELKVILAKIKELWKLGGVKDYGSSLF